MEIKSDQIQVASGVTDEKGNTLEPEEQPARRYMNVSVPMQLSGGQQIGNLANSHLSVEGDAISWAKAIMGLCKKCKNFDHAAWLEFIRRNEILGDMEDRQFINSVRAYLMESGNASISDMHMGADGEMDVEDALRSCGICRPLTEVYKEICIVHPMSGCPPKEVPGPHGEDLSNMFVPREETESVSSAQYDAIMRAAQGKPK